MARILVVDESSSVQMSVRYCLELAGHAVLQAEDWESGLAMAREQPVDLFLVNVGRPLLRGIDFCRAVKADPRLRHLPVVMMTGARTEEVVEKATAAGAAEVLSKPFDVEGLNRSLGKHLQPGGGPSPGAAGG